MSETAFRSEERFTADEFRQWLAERPRGDINHYELINGRIVMTPPAAWPHGDVEGALVMLLRSHVSKLQLGKVLGSSAGYELPSGDILEPDVSYISNQRFAAGPAPVRGQFLKVAPSLAVEILSKSTARRDRTEKKDVYARNAVDEYWIVDTDRREITVFVLQQGAYGTGHVFSSGRVTSKVLPGLELTLEETIDL